MEPPLGVTRLSQGPPISSAFLNPMMLRMIFDKKVVYVIVRKEDWDKLKKLKKRRKKKKAS